MTSSMIRLENMVTSVIYISIQTDERDFLRLDRRDFPLSCCIPDGCTRDNGDVFLLMRKLLQHFNIL